MTQPGGGEPLRKIKLTDVNGTSYELVLAGGDSSINEVHLSPNPVTPGGTGKYGDFDPSFGYIEQRDWSRGFGIENLSDDTSRYFSTQNGWTATPERLFPQLKTYWAKGFKTADYHEADDLVRTDSTLFEGAGGEVFNNGSEYTTAFTPSTSYTAKNVYFWVYMGAVKTIGDTWGSGYATVRARIISDSGGTPTTVLGTSNVIDYTDLEDYKIALLKFTFSTGVSLTASTTYHLSLWTGSVSGSGGNLVPLGEVGTTGTTQWAGYYNIGGSSNTIETSWYRVEAADEKCKIVPFTYSSSILMAVKVYDDGSNGKLYINGDVGKVTSATSTTLTDSNEGLRGAWTTSQWVGATVWVRRGKGAGQVRTITANNTSGQLTVATWDITPDTTSEYVICDTNDWAELSTTGLTSVMGKPVQTGEILYFPQGYGVNIRRARWNKSGSPPAMQYADDGTNDADVMGVFSGKVYTATHDDGLAKRSEIKAWGTDLVLSAMKPGTNPAYDFTNMVNYNNNLYIFKSNEIYKAYPDTTAMGHYPVGIGYMPNQDNGQAACVSEEYLYFNWAYSLERISGNTVDNLDPNSGAGMPPDYRGVISDLTTHPAGVFFSVDAGTGGISSVNVFDGLSYHQVLCLPVIGQRIRSLLWRSVPERQPQLMVGWGDNLVYQKYPLNHTNPLKDSNCIFTHGFELITGTVDMNAKGLKKMFRDVSVAAKNIPTDSVIQMYYQTDDDIGTNNWTSAGEVNTSGEIDFTVTGFAYRLGNVLEMRMKFLVTNTDGSSPPQINATAIKAFGRTPVRKQWSIAIDVSKTMENLGSGDPETMMAWFDSKAENADVVLMTSEHPRLHNSTVVIIPRSMRTTWINSVEASFSGVAYMELREA